MLKTIGSTIWMAALVTALVGCGEKKDDDKDPEAPAGDEGDGDGDGGDDGDGDEAPAPLPLTGSLSLTRSAVKDAVDAASNASFTTLRRDANFAGLSSHWTANGYGLGGDAGETPKEVVANYFNTTDDAQYFSVKRRVIDGIDLICVVSFNLPVENNMPKVGDSEFTLSVSKKNEIVDACGVAPSFFDNVPDGLKIEAKVEDVSTVEGTAYDRKITLVSEAFTNIIYYRGNETDGVNFIMHEPSSTDADVPEDNKSTTVLSFNPTTNAVAFDYISSYNAETAPAKEVLRFISDGTTAHLAGFLVSGFDSGNGDVDYYVVNASYKLASPVNLTVSVSSSKVSNPSNNLSGANACIKIADYTVATDNSLACEVTGNDSAAALTFFNDDLSKLAFTWHAAVGPTRKVSFSTVAEMLSKVPQ